MDIEKGLSRISEINTGLSLYDEVLKTNQEGRDSLTEQMREEFERIRKSIESYHGRGNPLLYSLLYFGAGYNDVLARLDGFVERLEKEPGNPIVIHRCESVPVEKEEGHKGTDHVSEVKTEILGIVGEGGYLIDNWNFYILLDKHARSDRKGHVMNSGKYKLDPRIIRDLNHENGYRFFDINHIDKEMDTFFGPEIPEKYTQEGRVLTPEEFAVMKRK